MPASIVSVTDDNQIQSILRHVGYTDSTKIADALRGSVWRASDARSNSNVVIKSANKKLHHLSIVIVDGIQYNVAEDILAEASIMQYLTADALCPNSLVKYIKGFESDKAIFIAMQDGGCHSLFDFTQTAHQCIESGKLPILEWYKMVQLIFHQMLECIEYMHSKNVCHFDISLENCVINEVDVQFTPNGDNLTFCIDETVQAKICDLGLAKFFQNGTFMSAKFCGKKPYRSPENVSEKNPFDAKKNDVFALGVCLFMMICGNAPWDIASTEDRCFAHIMSGGLASLLESWNVAKYVNEDIMALFHGFFQYEERRITLEDIKKNPWMITHSSDGI